MEATLKRYIAYQDLCKRTRHPIPSTISSSRKKVETKKPKMEQFSKIDEKRLLVREW